MTQKLKDLSIRQFKLIATMNSAQKKLLREFFKGENTWGDDNDFANICTNILGMSEEECESEFKTWKQINQQNGWLICPDGRA